MKVIDNANSKELVRLILNARKDVTVDKTQIEKLDYIVTSESEKYGIAVRYRNIPETETCSQVFDDTEELKDVCSEKNLIPTIAFVLYDTNRIRTYIFTVGQLEELAKRDDIEEVVKKVDHGLQIKYGINKTPTDSLLDKLKMYLDCTELTIDENTNDFTRQ